MTNSTNPLPKLVQLKSGVKVDINATEHSGQLSSVKYKKDNGWAILTIGGVDCVGVFHEINVGAAYKLKGKYEENQKYNTWNFKITEYTVDINTTNGIRELLISECPSLGPALANRLVTRFQNETLKVISREPEQVAEFLKISLDQARKVKTWATGQSENLETKQKLYKIGLTPGKVKAIMNSYGAYAEQKIKKDCFGLTKIHGFGFKTVAAIADLIGVPKDDPGRIKAAIKHCLGEFTNEGHTCIHCSEILRAVYKLTEVPQGKITPLIEDLIKNGELIPEQKNWEEYAKQNSITL